MNDRDADLVTSERWIVARREVVVAVGGLDEGFERAATALADFCLKARQREFRCLAVDRVDFADRCRDADFTTESDRNRLARKWASYPEYLGND